MAGDLAAIEEGADVSRGRSTVFTHGARADGVRPDQRDPRLCADGDRQGRADGGAARRGAGRFEDARAVFGPLSADDDAYFEGRIAEIDEMLGASPPLVSPRSGVLEAQGSAQRIPGTHGLRRLQGLPHRNLRLVAGQYVGNAALGRDAGRVGGRPTSSATATTGRRSRTARTGWSGAWWSIQWRLCRPDHNPARLVWLDALPHQRGADRRQLHAARMGKAARAQPHRNGARLPARRQPDEQGRAARALPATTTPGRPNNSPDFPHARAGARWLRRR